MKGLEAKTLGLRKVIRHEYKRIVAFMLTVAMVVTNFGTNLTVAFAAGEEESSLFLLNSSELEDAISTALESGDVFDFSSLELKAKQKSLKTSYEKLIGSKAGKVYQLDVDIDSSYATEHTDLQVFYNAGTDDVVFLFINESDMAVTFRANVSGYETARVTVNPNTTNIEDAEGVENAEDYSGTTMVDDEKKPQAEVVKPEGETSESENASDETEAAETEADVTESENASENGEAEKTTGAEEAAETETTAAEETEAETEPETEAETPAAEETEAEIELTPEEGSASASISAKKVFRVSTSAEAAGEAPAADAEEETEAETEAETKTEAEEPEKETEAPAETTAEETVADDSTEETTAADETDGELTDETEAPTEDVTTPDETTGEQPADNGGSENIGFDNDEQFLEDDSIELAGELNGKAYNTVTIWGSANARAYVVKAEDLTGEAAVEGQYSVDYSVDPVGAATIKGAHTVNEGETLYFAVDPQVGYEITEVTANGEPLEEADAADVASASDLEQHEHVYAVEAVTEDLEIVASLEETVGVAHPEFSASYVSSEGVTISLHAEEGILPEGTELSVTEVTDALGDTIKEKMDSEAEGTTVHSVLAYDINLLYNGKKLSNSWSESGYVDVTFTGAPIQEMTEASDKVEIVAVDDTSKTQLSAENAAEAEAGELKLETVSEQNVEDAAVEEVGFKAEHFTIYAVAASSGVMAASIEGYNANMKIGQTQTLRSNKNSSYHAADWETSDPAILQVTGSGKTAVVTAVGVGTATITHSYYTYEESWIGDWKTDTATITVTADPITGVTLTGEDTVKAFDSIKLTAKTEPVGSAASSLEWESSNTAILTVDNTGNVTGVAPGTAIVTVHATSSVDAKVYTATKEITVIPATQSTDRALFYYLKTPTSDPKSNATDQWGECIGEGTITVTGGTWVDYGKNMYSPTHRVLTWPDGSTGSTWTIDKNEYGSHWDAIFNAYKRSVESKYNGVTLTKDDIQSITLIPYKISRNNSSNPDKHVDCQVRIDVNDFYNAIYYVEDAGETGFQSVQQSGPYRSGDKTEPTATTAAAYPATKEKNGVTYTFVGWYDNDQFTGNVISFPYAMHANKEFYAKYVAGYNVNYDLDGGSWNIPNTYFKNAGSNVYVVGTTPTKTGYDFDGWDRQDEDSHVYVANERFTMPDKNVTFTAKWTPKEVSYTVNYYWAGTTTSVAESKTVTGKHFGDVINDEVPVEAEGYTAINTPQSLTLGSGDNIINFYYYKNVILTANSDEKTYNGNEQNVHGYTCSVSGVVFSGITAVANGTDATEYTSTFTENAVGKIDNSRRYIVESTHTGLLKIKPRPVTVKAASDEKEYDGTVLTNAGWSVEAATETTGLVGTDTIGSVTVTGSQLYPGSSSNVPSEASFTSGKETNYQINYVNGTLKVKDRGTKYVITANAADGEYTYDGTAKTASGVTYETLTFGEKTYTVEGLSSSRTETDVDPTGNGYVTTIVGTAVVKDSAGNDVTSQFRVDTTDTGLLKIKPRPVTVKAASDEKEYDGTVLTNAGWSVEAATETTGLVGTDTIGSVTVTGSQLYPGSSSNVPSEASFTSGEATNYHINYVNGTLKVKDRGTKYVITANAADGEYTYDGTAKTASGVTYETLTFGEKTYTVEGLSSSRTETDVDPTGNGYVTTIVGTAVVKDSAGNDVTSQFSVDTTDTGLLKIKPREVTVTAASDEKEYDGTVLTNAGWSVKEATETTGLVGNDTIGNVTVT
ncbi:Ig-like domain-containing protein [Lacrimispora indolis]|uniref:Ig-like domain-containing protein n=1 Tax=Lacrimispora indolis TaxID=69825 RepID=UPI0035637A59